MNTCQRIVLNSRPTGMPTPDHFQIVSAPIPQPQEGQILLRTLYLSLDPYMRGRMSSAKSYAKPVEIGDVMVGGAVCVVEQSRHPEFQPGDRVVAYTGWQTHALSDGQGLYKINDLSQPSLALGVLGMPGFTAYMGLLEIGKPKSGETVVVAAATGAVGSVVGQIARLKGCRVVGIAGGQTKCNYAVQTLGFDACIDHHSPTFAADLADACPAGIDVYFENVGGAVFDAVLPLLNTCARVPVCGLIAQYNGINTPERPDQLPVFMRTMLSQRITMRAFIIFDDFGDRYGEFLQQMADWVSTGKIRYREDVVEGFAHTPQAFLRLFSGENFGKLVVHVSD